MREFKSNMMNPLSGTECPFESQFINSTGLLKGAGSLFRAPAIFNRWVFLVLVNLLVSASAFADYTIPAGSTVDASTLTGKSGVLIINGKLNLTSDVYLSGFTSVIINGPTGQIYWTNNCDLTFKAGNSIDIDNSSQGLQPTTGNGNSSQRLIIGSAIIAVSSDKSSVSTFSFEQFNLQGGLPEYTLSSNSPVCAGNAIFLSVAPEKIVSGVTYSYQWSVSPASGSFSYNADKTTASISPSAGDYTITCIATANAFSKTKTISVNVRAGNTWLGVNSNWNDAANWCPAVPGSSSNITIPASANSPVISASTIAAVNNLTIASGAALKVLGTLNISGAISNNGTLNATKGTIGMNGASAQTIAGSMFSNKTIQNLIINNTSSAGVSIASTLHDTLKLSGTLTFGNSTAKLNTGDNLNLLSTSAATASVGIVGTKNSIVGKAIVDRYINLGTGSGQHDKSWQLLATPTNGQTVKQSWMEDQRLAAGYGTLITSPAGTAAGFDAYSPGVSIKYYDDATNSYIAVANANDPVYNPKGYMLFIRGDRTVSGFTDPPRQTILRSKGNLNTGSQTAISVLANHYQSVGNPYASSVDFTLLTRSGGVDNKFYTWDPFLYGSYGVGGYQTISASNNWQPVPGGTTAYPSGATRKTIQSGQAVFVHATGTVGGTISFNENSKTTGSANFARKASREGSVQRQFLRVSLFTGPNPDALIADGNAVAFDEAFSNNIDADDALKILNSGENFGIQSGGKILAVEAKAPLAMTDTIYYSMSNLRRQTYQLRFVPENLQATGFDAFLLDKFLNTSTPISLEDSSFVNISITADHASAATDRFEVVFRQMAALPVAITSIKAVQKNKDILVEWNVENESSMQKYRVEKSLDGNNFTSVADVAAGNKGAAKYDFTDINPSFGNNYYRINSITKDGNATYSQIVKVSIASASSISIFPNPLTKGIINLQFTNAPAGKYGVRLINPLGEVVISKIIHQTSGNNKERIQCDHLSKGIYQLNITKPDGSVVVEPIVVL
jgi:hypothetical protein